MVEPSILPLVAREIEVVRDGARVLGPVSVTVQPGGITVVMGPNGSGKTTLLRALHGLDRVRRGSVVWATALQDARRRQAFVFQTPILLRRSVLDNIAYPLMLDGVARGAAQDCARVAAADVGLGDRVSLPAVSLSGGEKQKLALARALIRRPEVVFLDEPCANLDGSSTREIEAVLIAARDAGCKVVLSTHNVGQARRLAADVLFLYKGRLHDSGPAPEFLDAPTTPEARAHLNGDLLP